MTRIRATLAAAILAGVAAALTLTGPVTATPPCDRVQAETLSRGGNHGCPPRPCPPTSQPTTVPPVTTAPTTVPTPQPTVTLTVPGDVDDADVSLLSKGGHHPRPSCSPTSPPTSVPPTTTPPATTPPTTVPTTVPPVTTPPTSRPATPQPTVTEPTPEETSSSSAPAAGTGGADDDQALTPVGNDLPLTGPAITMFAVAGAAVVAGGVVLLYAARRRKTRYVA